MADKNNQSTPKTYTAADLQTSFDAGVAAAQRNKFGIATVATLKTTLSVLNGFRGSKSVRILEVVIPITSCGASVTCPVYVDYVQKPTGFDIDVHLSLPSRQVVFFEDDDDRTAFLAHGFAAAQSHPKYRALVGKATALLTGRPAAAPVGTATLVAAGEPVATTTVAASA